MNLIKQEQRKNILEKRNCLTVGQINCISEIIINKLIKLEAFKQSNVIMCYMDFNNEVKTKDFINLCFIMGKRVAIPYIKSNSEMVAVEIINIENDVVRGSYGILEPKNNAAEIEPKEIDFVITPGIAFDKEKNRLGYGKGYYDRFLEKVKKNCFKVAIAYDFQILDSISKDNHDIPLDMIISEKRIII